jgi:hypothetical protein
MILFLNCTVTGSLLGTSLNYHRFCGLYYKPIMTVNDDSRIVNMLETSLIDDARVVIYDCHMFIVQATDDM